MAVVKRRAVPKSTPEQLEKYKQEQESKNREVHLEMEEQNQQQKVQQSIENEKSKEEYVLEKFIPSTSKNTNRVNCKKGVVTLVNYQSGKRIIISEEALNKLNNPVSISISFSDDSVAIGEDLPNNNNLFNVRYCKSRGIIYSSALISEITSKYELDFTDKVSITFTEWKYVSVGKSSAIIVKIV